jgi:transposase
VIDPGCTGRATTSQQGQACTRSAQEPRPCCASVARSQNASSCTHQVPISGELRKLGKDSSEILDYVPASFYVIRHVRPKMSCRGPGDGASDRSRTSRAEACWHT